MKRVGEGSRQPTSPADIEFYFYTRSITFKRTVIEKIDAEKFVKIIKMWICALYGDKG